MGLDIGMHGVGVYRIVGNFREAQIFAIFAIQPPLAKICSHEKFIPVNILHGFLHL